ncbi:hypothetical protein M5X11_23115 [Paenibacillus alginolyticus]|uniref:Uncharacterized protein n=1 Tax=Paenibacillus alginolyticus TaxID=59839 RepID=A0ABT4G6C7_9BACL|nr:hypothetical protein [Paenibacillus alginolyticus]MCY9667776.1 hypothetical protein [Paenibacillus alginolyticus]MCY9691704.1 hypothetical protein [Paenibacillus alginolyticus]MEC0144054.1 hypothetical protein [Paenibacillus alginolyticus]
MTIFGIILAIIIAILIAIFLGPYGGIVLLAIIFGLVLSTHQRNKKMYEDMQRIKERLGIVDRNDFHMTNEEIEQELELEVLSESEQKELEKVNVEIEEELETYLNKGNDKKKDLDTDK